MSKFPSLSLILVVAALGLATPLAAQQRSAVSGAELDAAASSRRPVGSRPTAPGVRAVGTPGQSQAAVQQSVVQSEDEALAGGDSVVIGTTALIIILLVVIILLVA
jgi:hypothetical protein